MTISRNNLVYALLGIAFASVGAIVIGNLNIQISLYIVAALFAIVLAIAIYIHPSLGAPILIVAVFTNISRQFTDRGLPGVIKPLVVIVAVAALVQYINLARVPRGRVKTGKIETLLVLFLMVTAFSYIAADNKERAIEMIVDLAKDIVIIYCILFTLRNPNKWKQSAWIIILVTAFLCLLGGYQVISGNYSQEFFGLARVIEDVGSYSTTHRIAGPIKEPNIWAQIVVAVVPLVIYRFIYERSIRMKLFMAAILGILLFEVLNTYSRGAYVGLAIIFIFVMMRQWRRNSGMVITGIITIITILVFLPSSYSERFRTLLQLTPSNENGIYEEGSFRGRSSEMLTGLKMFSENPLLGVGAGNYPNNYQEYTQHIGLELSSGERDPHSLYVQILAETGIIGGLTFIGFSILLLINLSLTRKSVEHLSAYQNWEPWISAIQLTIIAYLITSIFLHGAYLRYFWIFAALAISAIQLTEKWLNNPRIDHSLEPSI